MPSATDICNRALSRVGEARITSLTDDSKQARACNSAYAHIRDEVLRAELVAGLGERGDVRDHREAEQRDELDLLEQKNFKRGSQRVTEDQMRRERSSLKVTCWSILFT